LLARQHVVKPASVIVGDFGETIVIDWGLAKDLSAQEDPSADPFRPPPADDLTATGDVLGTPGYMAPEQKRGEQIDQRRADTAWCLGCLVAPSRRRSDQSGTRRPRLRAILPYRLVRCTTTRKFSRATCSSKVGANAGPGAMPGVADPGRVAAGV
jgi:serine/threonine protein kinase